MTISDLLEIAKQASVVACLIVFIFGFQRGWWVWGSQYAETREECESWKETALSALGVAERIVPVREQIDRRRLP